MQVHHACTDGTGVYRFLGDVLAIYAAQTDGVPGSSPDLGDLDVRLLRQRRTRFADLAVHSSTRQFLWHGIRQTVDIFARRIRPLAIPSAAKSSAAKSSAAKSSASPRTPFPGIVHYRFGQSEHKQLRAVAAEHGGMLNDLLMAELFCTIRHWNEEHGQSSLGDQLRIMMPSDLREQQDYRMPATNMTAYTFMTRRAAHCDDFAGLMKSVREQTARIKHDQLGRSFMDTVLFASYGQGILRYLLSRDRCISTAILSNIGDPTKRFTSTLPRRKGKIVAGNLILDDVTGVPPMRTKSRATIAVFSYLRTLTLSLRCDPYHFDQRQSQAFLDLYGDRLRAHLER